MKLHPSITIARITTLVEDEESMGLCVACGAECAGVEPDARRYVCDVCGLAWVFGAEELLCMATP